MSERAISIEQLKPDHKMALVFGTELRGISDIVDEQADELIRIPMFGFTESFNLSVSVAIFLQSILPKKTQYPEHWSLSDDEKESLRLTWYKKVVRRSQLILDRKNEAVS
jgi:tRNA (guanosine-2'-O-)-methyltransferase